MAQPLHYVSVMSDIKNILIFVFLVSLILLHGSFAQTAEEPTLRQLEAAALKYSSLDPQEVMRWKSRVKWAKALPQVMVGYDQKFVNQINNTIQDSISVTSSNITVGPPQAQLNQNNNLNQGFEARATWSLDELIFNKDSLSISSESRYRTVMRSQVLDELYQIYFERKKLLLREGEKKREEFSSSTQLRLEELEAKLDSLTGGYFSKTTEPVPGEEK